MRLPELRALHVYAMQCTLQFTTGEVTKVVVAVEMVSVVHPVRQKSENGVGGRKSWQLRKSPLSMLYRCQKKNS